MKVNYDYYQEKLAADKLKQCYDIAPPRVKQYLEAEIEYVLGKITTKSRVLELGCGYGRVLMRLAGRARFTAGLDTSYVSLSLYKTILKDPSDCILLNMNAIRTGLRDRSFDIIVCIQNGISAFHVGLEELIRESIRITRTGGLVLFSSYTDTFWPERLKWFRIQSDAGLIGEIDMKHTHDGIIVSKDGFTTRTVRPDDFRALVADMNVNLNITVVDNSSIFYEIIPR